MKAASLSQATKVPEVTAFICTMSSISKLFTSFFLILFFKLNLWFWLLRDEWDAAENRVRYFPWIQNDLPQQFSLLQEKESEREGRGKKKERHYFSELHATFIILPEVPHRDCVEGRKMKTAVEVLGYTAAPCCLWPLPTSAVCSNPGRECPYLLPLTKASLLPLRIIKTVVCLSAKLLRQLQKVIESATRLAPGAATQRGCPCWDSNSVRGGLRQAGTAGLGVLVSSHRTGIVLSRQSSPFSS